MKMTLQEYKASTGKAKKSKYGNKKVMLEGVMFDSVAEANRWSVLRIMEKAGEITDLQRQVPFAITAPNGELICTYRCDAAYWHVQKKRRVIEDTKGVETDLFKLKKKLMRIFLGIEIEVVK